MDSLFGIKKWSGKDGRPKKGTYMECKEKQGGGSILIIGLARDASEA